MLIAYSYIFYINASISKSYGSTPLAVYHTTTYSATLTHKIFCKILEGNFGGKPEANLQNF